MSGVAKQGGGPPRTRAAYLTQWLLPDREAEWDAFVARHPLGSLYQTTKWKRVIEKAFPHIRSRFLVLREDESGRILGGLPIYTVKSWLLGTRRVSVPFATACDPLVATLDEWEVLVRELQTKSDRSRSGRLEIRAVLSAAPMPPFFGSQSHFKHHTLRLDGDFDTLCRGFDKHSVRQKAEKARRAGVVVTERSDIFGMRVSHLLLAETRRRLCLPPMPYRFFEAMQNALFPEHLKIFLAHQNAKPVACHVVLMFKDQWISEYSGNANGAISGVNQLLYLETIRQARAEGARRFSFGRTSVDSEGLLSYKRRWGAVEENLTDYTLLPDRSPKARAAAAAPPLEKSTLYTLCQRIIAKAPMPVCKVIGDFCYRHLG